MRQLLEDRIRAVFPRGNDWEPDYKELDANEYVQRINCVIKKCSSLLPLSVKSEDTMKNSLMRLSLHTPLLQISTHGYRKWIIQLKLDGFKKMVVHMLYL